jgi:hypothetical protein
MGATQNVVDLSSPARIAKAIVKVNRMPELRRAGLDVLWKLYYAAGNTLPRRELERDFGGLEDHFGLYCRRVAEELGGTKFDTIPLVNGSQDDEGLEIVTLKRTVVSAIREHAFPKKL